MGVFSFIFALIMLLLTLVALIPLLGWLNWILIPLNVISLVGNLILMLMNLGLKPLAKAGLVISIVALLLNFLRLQLGWGII